MAFTVTIESTQANFLLGDTFTLTAVIQSSNGEPIPSGIRYDWSLDTKHIGSTTNTYTVERATEHDAGRYMVTVTLPSRVTITSPIKRIAENALVVKINEDSRYVADRGRFVGNAVVTYALSVPPRSDYVLNYQWFKNDTEITGQTTTRLQLDNFSVADAGSYSFKAWGTSKESTDTATIELGHFRNRLTANLPPKKTAKIGHDLLLHFEIRPTLTGDKTKLPEMQTQYEWYLNRGQGDVLIGNEIGHATNGFSILPNGNLHKERATTDDDANFWAIARSKQRVNGVDTQIAQMKSRVCDVDVTEMIHKMHRYVHPLTHRRTSFLYVGWWVFDHIVAINEAGEEWRDPAMYSQSKYADDIETIAAAEETYGDCTLMETRNGFMYNASKLHHLNRETLEKVFKIKETPPRG